MDRLELLQVVYQGLTQLGQSRAALQHEAELLDVLHHAVSDPSYIEALRNDTYTNLRASGLTDFEKDAVQFILT